MRRHEESAKHNKSLQSHTVVQSSVNGQTVTGLQRLEELHLQPIANRQPAQGGNSGSPTSQNTMPPQDPFTIFGSGVDLNYDNSFNETPAAELDHIYDLNSLTETLDVGSLAVRGSGKLAIALNEWFASAPAIGDLSSDSKEESLDQLQSLGDGSEDIRTLGKYSTNNKAEFVHYLRVSRLIAPSKNRFKRNGSI